MGFSSLRAGPGGSLAGRRHGHIRCGWDFRWNRVYEAGRRTDGAALAVRQERLVSRSVIAHT